MLLKSVSFPVWVLLKSVSFLSNCTGSIECATARSVSNNVFIKPLYRQKSKLIARLTCHLALWTSYWTETYEWKLKRLISNLLHERNAKVKWKYIYIPVVVVAIKADIEFQFSFHQILTNFINFVFASELSAAAESMKARNNWFCFSRNERRIEFYRNEEIRAPWGIYPFNAAGNQTCLNNLNSHFWWAEILGGKRKIPLVTY